MQEDIVTSILDGNDTLALLPTGGGKSICFQVPAMAKEGMCLVISPLIALMKDQVQNLTNRGIKALAVYSGMSIREIDRILDNCVHGDYKFLYVSPERLKTDLFRARVVRMNINLIAVDEAHCISQWGYDFRPEYLQLNETRALLPGVPVIALTASATAEVAADIQAKLNFKNGKVYKSSFERANLSFVVRETDDKNGQLLNILTHTKGSGIIYAATRKAVKDIATFLAKNNISADFYHAGLSQIERSKRQENWIRNKTRIIACTNAFGMGIDKPDVRVVVHYHTPPTPEAYYQEAGRAGRDGKKSFAVLLYAPADITEAEEKLRLQYPDFATIRNIYHSLGSHLGVAIGSGAFESFNFDIAAFCKVYDLQAAIVIAAINLLERNEWLRLGEGIQSPSRLMLMADQAELYKIQVEQPSIDILIKVLARMYGGLFDHYLPISEEQIAAKAKTTVAIVQKLLGNLSAQGIADYIPRKDKPQVIYLQNRVPADDLLLNVKLIKLLADTAEKKLKAMTLYVENRTACRSSILRVYFGDAQVLPCGICDVCLETAKQIDSEQKFEQTKEKYIALTQTAPLNIYEYTKAMPKKQRDQEMMVVRWLLDQGILKLEFQLLKKV
jgi:ATP-dependent DNA helicase RecQ